MLSDGRHQPAVDAVLKLIVIGDTGAGKSSIMHRFIERRHDPRLANTTGVEFGVRTVLVDGSKVKLHVWVRQPEPTWRGATRPVDCAAACALQDTAGQERFRSVTKSYYRGAVGCIIVFDLTNRGSFEHVRAGWAGGTRPAAWTRPRHAQAHAHAHARSYTRPSRFCVSVSFLFLLLPSCRRRLLSEERARTSHKGRTKLPRTVRGLFTASTFTASTFTAATFTAATFTVGTRTRTRGGALPPASGGRVASRGAPAVFPPRGGDAGWQQERSRGPAAGVRCRRGKGGYMGDTYTHPLPIIERHPRSEPRAGTADQGGDTPSKNKSASNQKRKPP